MLYFSIEFEESEIIYHLQVFLYLQRLSDKFFVKAIGNISLFLSLDSIQKLRDRIYRWFYDTNMPEILAGKYYKMPGVAFKIRLKTYQTTLVRVSHENISKSVCRDVPEICRYSSSNSVYF